MNKRKAKKFRKKQDMFSESFASSYREMKRHDRMYHNYVVEDRRSRRKEECDVGFEWIFDKYSNK